MLYVIGIGPGRPEWLPPATHEAVSRCDVLVGGNRALQLFPYWQKPSYRLSGNLQQSLSRIADLLAEGLTVGVLVSGDPGFFSLLPALRREFPQQKISVLPGVSSLQLAFAKAGIPWQEASFISVHGRDLSSLPLVIDRPLAVLTGGKNTPQKVAQFLLARGDNPVIAVGNALAYPEEYWNTMETQELAGYPHSLENTILIIYPASSYYSRHNQWRGNPRLGIPDQEFIRGNVPMTKAEIRVQVLAKAQISPVDAVLDVGAGTGSISIEAAALAKAGMVYAVEINSEAQELILANKEKFGVPNLQLVAGAAPDVFVQIPPVNVCIIGGSKGRLADILRQVPLVQGGRLVMTAITLENAAAGLTLLKKLNYQNVDAVSIQVVRWMDTKGLHMAQSLNQVFIISATKGEKT